MENAACDGHADAVEVPEVVECFAGVACSEGFGCQRANRLLVVLRNLGADSRSLPLAEGYEVQLRKVPTCLHVRNQPFNGCLKVVGVQASVVMNLFAAKTAGKDGHARIVAADYTLVPQLFFFKAELNFGKILSAKRLLHPKIGVYGHSKRLTALA